MLRNKSKLLVIILSLVLLVSGYFNMHLYKYKQLQDSSYENKVQYIISNLELTRNDIYMAQLRLQETANKENAKKWIEIIKDDFQTNMHSFFLLNPEFSRAKVSTHSITFGFINELIMNMQGISIDTEDDIQLLIQDLQVLLDDFKYILKELNEAAYLENNPKWIVNKWSEVISQIKKENPGFRLYVTFEDRLEE